jgi:hypothetical protein
MNVYGGSAVPAFRRHIAISKLRYLRNYIIMIAFLTSISVIVDIN